MTLSSSATSRRVAFAAFVVLLALAFGVSGARAATARTPCGDAVVKDWFTHKKVEGHYPLHCYSDALGSLDPAVDTYTNARDAISQALAAERLLCKTNCGPNDSGGGSPAGKSGPKAIQFHNTSGSHGQIPPQPQLPPDQVPASSSNPSSVPVPLLVLAGLAVLLLLAGGASYLARRTKGSRPTPPAPDSAPGAAPVE
jgi:hypothetical protein